MKNKKIQDFTLAINGITFENGISFASEFSRGEGVKEIKIGDKVVLLANIAHQLPFLEPKESILNVDLIEGDKARVSTPVVSFVVPLELLIKVEEEKEIKEEVRVVRKLEDLDGLENGNGLKISSIKDNMNRYTIRTIMPESKSIITEWVIDKIEHVFDKLKYMGFKFEYNPPKSKEEIIQDVILSARKKCSNHRNIILFDVNKNKYIFTDNYANIQDVGVYYTEDLAEKFCNELNEALEG
ncbi:MAG: hypothetical protein ACRCX2_36545 [Paraclostridium sp.]